MRAAQKERSSPPRYWLKLALFLVCAVTVLIGLDVANQALITLRQLDQIEANRDTWQRPADIMQALNLRPGDSVLDLGCGSGYFSFKLSDTVGPGGKVTAEDIRRLSLVFLRLRIIRKGKHNITVLHGNIDGPHLRAGSVNAVLILNTYHEFTAAREIMEDVHQSLVPGGRVVIVDRSPIKAQGRSPSLREHEVSPDQVEADLRETDFQIDSRRDDFISSDPEGEAWWIIVAHR